MNRHVLSTTEFFVRVADLNSFKAAADQLEVTPAAVSKAIARLEHELGVKLLFRTTRRVTLTPEGKAFLSRCRAALQEIDAGLEAMEEARHDIVGDLHVSTSFVLGRRIAVTLPQLVARHPGLRVHLMQTDRLVDLAGERVDVAVRIGDQAPPDAVARPITHLEWATVASPRYLARRGWPTTPKELEDHDCHAFIDPHGRRVAWVFHHEGDTVRFEPEQGIGFDQGEMLVDVALADGGIAQVFDFMVADHLRDGRLVRLLPDLSVQGPVVQALCLSSRFSAPKVRMAVKHFEHVLGEGIE